MERSTAQVAQNDAVRAAGGANNARVAWSRNQRSGVTSKRSIAAFAITRVLRTSRGSLPVRVVLRYMRPLRPLRPFASSPYPGEFKFFGQDR